MKLLLDEGVPSRSAVLLRESGHDALHVVHLGMQGASDDEILARAKGDGAVVVTLDSDFHQALALSGDTSPSVIRIRQQGLSYVAMADWISRVVETTHAELSEGAAVSVNEASIRVRRLPLKGL